MAKKKRAQSQARPVAETPAAAPFSLRLPPPAAAARAGLWLGTLLVLFAAPFARGLYFPAEHLTAIIALAALFGLSWALRAVQADPPRPWRLLDWALLGLLLTYVLSLPVAANLRAAVGEALKFSAYLATYWLVATQARNGRAAVVVDVLVAGGVALVLVGLAALTGLAEVSGAVIYGRLASGLQYPNTLAAYLSALLFLTLLRREEVRPSAWRHGYGPAAFLMATGMFLALSRGATLVLLPAVAIFAVALPPGRRARMAVQLAAVVALGGLVAAQVGDAVGHGAGLSAWGWLLAGGTAAVAGGWLLETGWRLPPRARWAGAVVALAALLGLAARSGGALLGRLAPALGRLVDITRTDPNLLQRLVYNQDGLRIALSRPWLGAGGGGWEALYHSFQAYPYHSGAAHNFVLEHWIATGTPGLIVLVLSWGAFVGLALRTATRRPELRPRLAALTTAAIALGMHSLIDFNLALPAVGLLLFALFGLVRALADDGGSGRPSRRRRPSPPGAATVIALTAALATAVTAAVLLQGHLHGQRGIALLKEERYEQARAAFEQARKADPLMGSFAMDLATCYEALGTWRQDPELIERARAQTQDALSREPYNSLYHHTYGIFEFGCGRAGEALLHLERSVELFPAMAPYYANLARAHVLIGLHEMSQGQREAALGRARRALELEAAAVARAGLAPAFVPGEFRMALPDATLSLAAAQARVMLGEHEAALDTLLVIANGEQLAEVYVWIGLALEGLGLEPGGFAEVLLELDPAWIVEYEQLRELLRSP